MGPTIVTCQPTEMAGRWITPDYLRQFHAANHPVSHDDHATAI